MESHSTLTQEFISGIADGLLSIEDFNRVAGNLDKPVNPDLEVKMLKSEIKEYVEGITENNSHKIKDGLADEFVVWYGTLLKHGLKDEFPAILAKVCEANMTKFCTTEEEAQKSVEFWNSQGEVCHYEYNETYKVYVIFNADGKVRKSINFKEPVFD